MAGKKKLFINRELSWLEFNQRVLDEACDPSVPLLDRLFFLTVTASNLDEFYMVRVGGLQLMVDGGVTRPDPAGLRPPQQLTRIGTRVRRMVQAQQECFLTTLEPELERHGIRRFAVEDLSPESRAGLLTRFMSDMYPVFGPQAIDPSSRFPLLTNMGLYVAVMLKPEGRRRTPRFAMVPIPVSLKRVVPLPDTGKDYHYVLLEDVVACFVEQFFPGQEILAAVPLRITRNADMQVREEFADDLVHEMKKVLSRRRTSDCVRLEIDERVPERMLEFLRTKLGVESRDVMLNRGPIDMTGLRAVVDLDGFDDLRYEPWPPQRSALVDPRKPMFDQIRRRDIPVLLPYEMFDPVVRFVEEAADDPDVLAIKQVLYRVSAKSPILAALRRAADSGKQVTVLVELKARFDEANNIAWAERLERSGAQVIYGIKNLKTHAKICLVVRRETEGLVRYCHFGTGNYNDKTARLYTDVGILTRDATLGADASMFFNTVAGYSEPQPYQKLVQAPLGMRERLLELIEAETQRSRAGEPARIMARMNSLVDPVIIKALYEASQAGVEVQLNVRGICCLRPGVKKLSENIRVVSVIDRLLEHSRIFYFCHGGEDLVFISSADWMPRNLSRRIELMIPIEDQRARRAMIHILEMGLADDVKGRAILGDGGYRVPESSGRKGLRSQAALYDEACARATNQRRGEQTVFEPHVPPDAGDR